MQNVLLILLLFNIIHIPLSEAQETFADSEQKKLQLYYNVSKILNTEVDTLANPLLFETIYEWLGTPYKYAGDCREGVDCSGFTCMLYQTVFGIKLANSSAEIFKDVKPLKKDALEEGDLVFFKIRKRRVSHVGVYLGNNKFAHASVQSGVIVSDLDEPYYKKYFFKGGRVMRK
ncbi:MAG: NlpC/P60 family protein [Bacteroidetes bacterium]|nr:NlpC/P60 family protein [Bacteroidota bacterium]